MLEGLLRGCEIFGNLRITFVSSSTSFLPSDNVPHFVFSPILLSISFPSAAAAAAAFPPSVRGREPQKLALAGERSWLLGTGYWVLYWVLAVGYWVY